MVWGGRREEGSGWGTRVYLWWIHVDIWQNQYNIVKLKNKIFKKGKKKKKENLIGLEENKSPRILLELLIPLRGTPQIPQTQTKQAWNQA